MTVTEPIEGSRARPSLHPSQLGGTRHLSAAQFVHDQRDAVALVASQDGRFTVFAWSPCERWSTRTGSKRCFSGVSRQGLTREETSKVPGGILQGYGSV